MKTLSDEQVSRIMSAADAGEVDYMNHKACYAFHAFGESFASSRADSVDSKRWWDVSNAVGKVIMGKRDPEMIRMRMPKSGETALAVLQEAGLV